MRCLTPHLCGSTVFRTKPFILIPLHCFVSFRSDRMTQVTFQCFTECQLCYHKRKHCGRHTFEEPVVCLKLVNLVLQTCCQQRSTIPSFAFYALIFHLSLSRRQHGEFLLTSHQNKLLNGVLPFYHHNR